MMRLTTVRLSVTANDLLRGKPSNCDACPIARSLIRRLVRLPKNFYVSVDNEYFFVMKNTPHRPHPTEFERRLPSAAIVFIRRFDGKAASYIPPAKPCTFEIDLPTKWLKKPKRKESIDG